MRNPGFLIALMLAGCAPDISGTYSLEVTDFARAETGLLELVGSGEDVFGRLTLQSDPPRVYALGLRQSNQDSLYFTLGSNGFLVLRTDSTGRFKYFGVDAGIRARRSGSPPADLEALVELKPLFSTPDTDDSWPTVSPDGATMLFSRGVIMERSLRGTEWSEPDTAGFSIPGDAAPRFAPDGSWVLFDSSRPNPAYPEPVRRRDLWRVDRLSQGGWGEVSALPHPINVDSVSDYHGAVATSGAVYFSSFGRAGGSGRSDVFRGDASGVTWLGPTLNTDASEPDIFVDPAERYLILVSAGLEGAQEDDLFLVPREGAGWGAPARLSAPVNSFAFDYGAWVDPSGGWLYFNSFRRGSSDIYRVPLSDIPELAARISP
ncbi:MAG: PD40 domain-containing protein [Rhodothermales bacterium]|nr:PD40 domain-containing protein [Rhodothermales bacterium]MBO6779351.1 PD40 domain-containing protein [Rhodothermales bacterium]